MKKFILFIGCLFVLGSAFAQLSTRENDETVVKLGARPKAGDMSLVFGYDISRDGKSAFGTVNKNAQLYFLNSLAAGDLLTFKYYCKDDVAFRLAFRLHKNSYSINGTNADSSALNPIPGLKDTSNYAFQKDFKNKTVSSLYMIVPGIEKHFLKSNIFDVYIGADLLLGMGDSSKTINESTTSYKNVNKAWLDAKDNKTITSNFSMVGLGAVVGVNVFIAQLPISVGIEYGWNMKWTFGGVKKVKQEKDMFDKTGTSLNSYSATYYLDPNDKSENPTQYSELSSHSFGMDTNQNVRLVLNIYFGK